MSHPVIERPVLAVDVVVLCLQAGRLSVLLHRREADPFRGEAALPGVAVQVDETLLEAARRALRDKTGLSHEQGGAPIHLEQLATFDALFRDPRGRTVSVAYLGLLRDPAPLHPGATWKPVSLSPAGTLPFDHDHVLETALRRVRGKLRYTNIASRLVPETFKIEQLRKTYEALLGRKLNRSNFREKLLKIGLIERAGGRTAAAGRKGGRPAPLYRFTRDRVEAEERDFL